MDVTDAGITRFPILSTRSQFSAKQVELPATEKGRAASHTLHPLVPPEEVPVYPAAQTEQAAVVVPLVPVPGVLYPEEHFEHGVVPTIPSVE